VNRLLAALLLTAPIALTGCARPAPPPPDADPRIARIVASVSEQRIQQLVERLAAFGTRHTLSDDASPTRGIGAARQWIHDELKRSSAKLQVGFDTYALVKDGRITRDVELRNVIAVLPGKSARRIYVTAHYDTVSIPGGQGASGQRPAGQTVPDPQLRADQDYDIDAPGANDNGSGTALTMELARVLVDSGLEFDATLVFALWAGEEQGLFGSRAHAQRIAADQVIVGAVLNNDIVGNSRGGNGVVDTESVRVYSTGPEDSASRSLARYVERVARLYLPSHRVRLLAREDRFSRGSDHSSFSYRGMPAVVFREAVEDFGRQHAPTDTVEGVDAAYLARNARVNAAAAASLALAPAEPKVTNERGQPTIGRQPSGYDASLRWTAAPGAAAYHIYWRDAWANDWEQSQTVGNVTEFVLEKRSIDDFVFGVAAVGPGGHESPISAYVAPPRTITDVKLAEP
jgi:Zn-dependent M28 family amino/carboxypeptidase